MRLTIFHKLFVSLLVTSMVMVLGMALLINHSFQSGLQTYLNQREVEKLKVVAMQVSQYYSVQSGWQMLKAQPWLWENLLTHISEQGAQRRPPRAEHFQSRRLMQLHQRIHLLNAQGQPVFNYSNRHIYSDANFIKVPITDNDNTIGWISFRQKQAITGALAESFFKQQLNNFYLIAAWVALFSFIVAGLLVRHFLKPLKSLHAGAKALQQGDYQQQIAVRGKDELAELSQTFNSLTRTLKQQKESREQWLADISHELRTPIAVLLSEIEAIEDGIRQPEPKYISSLHNQVMTLRHLVDDLYQLSLSDSGVNIDRSEKVDLTQLLEMAANQNETRLAEKNIHLKRLYDSSKAVMLKGDGKSLTQLIANIFENSYRYTDAGGSMQISLRQSKKNIELMIEDSAPGVPEESLPKLFERLYRVDKSRSRANGGSGLGLSICENIVNAHGGKIVAEHSPLGGLKISISLPIKDI